MDFQERDNTTIGALHAPTQALIGPVVRNVQDQVEAMRGILGEAAAGAPFNVLEQSAATLLEKIKLLVAEGTIDPQARLRHSPEGGPVAPCNRELRIGVFPTAVNPLHWGHLLGGLLAVERFRPDKLIFPIAGGDPRKCGQMT